MEKIDISAIVVGFNEGRLLEKCFNSISFCDEILYFDLGSTDDSLVLAEKVGAKVIHHEKVLSCEWIHSKFANTTKHEWILITDPDEVTDINLAQQLIDLFKANKVNDSIGAILVPWIFYFKSHKLLGTAWGGVNKRIYLVNNKRFEFQSLIHVGRKVKEGYALMDINIENDNIIHHYWMQGWGKLFEKHKRYLRNEGEARYSQGQRTTVRNLILEPYRSFRYSFITKRGYKDGWLGFLLSLFWTWYQSTANYKLLKYQKHAVKAQ